MDNRIRLVLHALVEALGVYQSHEVIEPNLLARLCAVPDPNARAYAAGSSASGPIAFLIRWLSSGRWSPTNIRESGFKRLLRALTFQTRNLCKLPSRPLISRPTVFSTMR